MACSDKTAYTAQLLDPDDAADRAALERLRADPAVEVIDERDAQLEGLRSIRPVHPELVAEPGRWAYYPWRRTVVALVGPRAFHALRLDRNRNNITDDEQRRLGALRIGVAGLSVGHVVAHTLAAQGLCGFLRLADFDRLELSNLNRVPATVFDLGLNKAHAAARRIAELDPYLPVDVLDTGLTVESVDTFLDGLDILVEECDSLHIKAILREGARARGIPVLMATSDRGIIDVERFDLEPDRPILHGLLGDLDIALLPGMSSRDKIPHILRHLEADQLSARTAASLIEVDRSLSTWPQVASDVIIGASALAEAVRRIGLGETLRSGRTRVDVGEALNRLAEPEMARQRPAPTEPDVAASLAEPASDIAAAAIRAPSGGNTQPWRIDTTPEGITIEVATEHTDVMDVGYRASSVAVGAALFNARVAAAASGKLGPITMTHDVGGAPLRAAMQFGRDSDPALAALYEAMLARETNRHQGTARPFSTETAASLRAAAQTEGAALHLLTDRADIATAATLLGEADRMRYLTPRLHADMIDELRWPGDAEPDTGIDVRSLELDDGQLEMLELLRRPDVMAHLAEWNAGSVLGDDTRDRILASSALAVIAVPGTTLRDFALGGAAVEAVWITAQQHGLAVQPVSPVFLYALNRSDFDEISPSFAGELTRLQTEFQRLSEIPSQHAIALILRLATAQPPSTQSRRDLGRVREL